jgi:hypothetical protein
VSFPQIFAKGKSLKSVGIGMLQDKYKGQHGDMGHAEPIFTERLPVPTAVKALLRKGLFVSIFESSSDLNNS